MDRQELEKIIGEKVGATYDEFKIALDIFTEKVTACLQANDVIKIDDIGLFQLIENTGEKKSKSFQESTEVSRILLYAPSDYRKGSVNVLELNVNPNEKKESESIDNVFSISIGKPLIPLDGSGLKILDTQSSDILTRKSFEKRIENILKNTEHLKDFTIEYIPKGLQPDIINTVLSDDYPVKLNVNETIVPWNFGIPSEIDNYSGAEEITNQDEKQITNEQEVIQKSEYPANPSDVLSDFKADEEKEDLASEEDSIINEQSNSSLEEQEIVSEGTKGNSIEEELTQSIKPFISEPQYFNNIHSEEKTFVKWLFVLIPLIIIIVATALYYYFYIYKRTVYINTNKYKTELKDNKGSNIPIAINDTSGKSIEKGASEPSDNPIRKNTMEKMVKDYLYTDGTKYTIQVSSWKARLTAEREMKKLREKGYDAYIIIKNPDSNSPFYCVRVGEYRSVEEAEIGYKKL